MPSLQQLNLNESLSCKSLLSSSTITRHTMRSPNSLTTETVTVGNAALAAVGTELLQQHSINSIIEQRQDFLTTASRHTNDVNTTLTNTIGTTITTPSDALSSALNDPLALTADFLGLGSCTNNATNTATLTSNILPLANVGGVVADNNGCNVVGIGNMVGGCGNGGGGGGIIGHTNLDTLSTNNTNPNSLAAAYMPLTPSSTQSSISPGNATNNPYDMFQFENIAPQHQQNTPLKAFQRNISFDCSAPLSPSTPSSLYNNSFQSSPLVSDSSNSSSANGLSLDSIPMVYQNGYQNGLTSTRSTSPESQNSNQSNENNLIDMMKFLNVGNNAQQTKQKQLHHQQHHQHQQQQHLQQQQQQKFHFQNLQQQQQQQQQRKNETNSTANDFDNITNRSSPATNLFDEQNLENFEALSAFDMELTKLQALNAVTLLQAQQQQVPLLQNLLQTYNTINQLQNWQMQQQQNHALSQPSPAVNTNGSNTNDSDAYLDRVAKFYRGSAAFCEPTCTWSGQLPPRSHRLYHFSPKVFLGGIPWDVSEQALIQIFKPFGPVKVEWPGKEQQAAQPKGYVYIIFESDKQVKALLSACAVQTDDIQNGSGIFFFKISSRRIKAKDVEVIPWLIGDSNYVKSTSQKLDPTKTVFVGALHGKLTAEALAQIMDDLFDGVLYAGLDTDKNKYPIGSGRVTFNNNRSYMKAVSAAFIEVRTPKFTKKLQIDPYLEDSLCSICGVQHGPYYCRELSCFRYFCFTCWQWQHSTDAVKHHQPLTRNSKSQTLVGIGPVSSTSSLPSFNSRHVLNSGGQQQTQPQQHQHQLPQQHQQQQQQQQQQYQHLLSSLSQTQNFTKNSSQQPQQQHQSSLPQIQTTVPNAFHL